MNKKYLGIGAVVLAVAVAGGWYFANKMATDHVVKKVQQYIVENKLQDAVKYDTLEASVAGTATMTNVVLKDEASGQSFKIKKIDIDKLINEENHKVITATFEGLTDENGVSPIAAYIDAKDDIQSLGYDDAKSIPPLNGSFSADYDKAKDSLDTALALEQAQMIDLGYTLKAQKVNGFVDLIEKHQKAQTEPAMGEMMAAVTPLMIEQFTLTVKNNGLIDKSNEADKKKSPPGEPFSVEKCQSNLAMVAIEVSNDRGICTSVPAFINGQSKTLNVMLKPEKPYAVMNFVALAQGGMPDMNKIFQEIGLSVSN